MASIPVIFAQETSHNLRKGDVVILADRKGTAYRHLDFPRKNIIIKRGAIADFNNLIGKKLVVERIETTTDGITIAVLKRKDGLNFFRFYPRVRADIEKALTEGELKYEDTSLQK